MNAKLVKLQMVAREMKVIDLSRKLDMPYDRLVRILGGFRKVHLAEARAIADAIGVTVDELEARILPDEDRGPKAA